MRPRPAAPHSGATPERQEARWLWATLMLSSVSIVATVFAAWELVEARFFQDVDYVTLHSLYLTRGIGSSLLLAAWAAWYVLSQRRRGEEELRRSREHYRNLLESSPGAVALFDEALRVTEWNRAAERLYGFSREGVLGQPLPTVPDERRAELRDLIDTVAKGALPAALETLRRDSRGALLEVQVRLLPFSSDPGPSLFLEVSEDIRERVRLRQTLLEVEKLTSMGKTAAGTAHHLNTPLAAMLLRVQMMRERVHDERTAEDLERLEGSLHFCQQFVRRLLEFSRRPAADRQPEDLRRTAESVVSFLGPSFEARGVQFTVDLGALDGARVLADRNLLETLFSILLANALDAVASGGRIAIRSPGPRDGYVEVRVEDDGCGIAPADRARVFEPFFTTKGTGKGTGLGLAIARSILLEHGGSVRLEAAAPRGTVAIVELPVLASLAPGVAS